MNTRWKIIPGKILDRAIEWQVKDGDCHTDDIEMAGFSCAAVVKYGVTDAGFELSLRPVFPTLRMRPNDTHASYQPVVPKNDMPRLTADGYELDEKLIRAEIEGLLRLETSSGDLHITHTWFPSVELRAVYEIVKIENCGEADIFLGITCRDHRISEARGPMGINVLDVTTSFAETVLPSGGTYEYAVAYTGRLVNEERDFGALGEIYRTEYEDRIEKIKRLTSPMRLDTGNEILDTMFEFAKIRAGESVYDTMYGLIHSPGGLSYYAATWCNDQVEYAGPYFAYTGDEDLLEASMNAYRMYMPFMSESYERIPSSVIAEGIDYWDGAGDRGDAAMYLYGASRFALASGIKAYAEELMPAIEWCAEYTKRQIGPDGVVRSDADELEGRFSHGDYNLCTNTLAYAGYRSAADLMREMGREERADEYTALADGLYSAIEKFFGAVLHGCHTYRYHEGCDLFRSWICMPLCVGIFDRAEGTVRALTSDILMKPDGMLTSEDSATIWDRSTLYGLRGLFASGYTERASELLMRYCTNRLLGERVPYAVEAYPEGGRRHLSGESALFCKVITEGVLNMVPTGLCSFKIKPTLPEGLDHVYLGNIIAHGALFDVTVDAVGVRVMKDGKVIAEGRCGEEISVNL